MKIKILQWNIWYQENVVNILKLIEEYNPDILCFQELTFNCEYNPDIHVADYIAERL
jgi:exonuclease III